MTTIEAGSSGDGVRYLRKLGGVVSAVDGAGARVLPHRGPHLGRPGDGVHLAGVAGT